MSYKVSSYTYTKKITYEGVEKNVDGEWLLIDDNEEVLLIANALDTRSENYEQALRILKVLDDPMADLEKSSEEFREACKKFGVLQGLTREPAP